MATLQQSPMSRFQTQGCRYGWAQAVGETDNVLQGIRSRVGGPESALLGVA